MFYVYVVRQQGGFDPCTENYIFSYLNIPEVQAALHANVTGDLSGPWEACKYDRSLERPIINFMLIILYVLMYIDYRLTFFFLIMVLSDQIHAAWTDWPATVLPVIEELMESNISVWIYRQVK